MKLKTHILPAFVFASIVAVSPSLRAADPVPSTSPAAATSPAAPEGEHQHMNPMERLTKALDLTQDQQAKLKPIFEDRKDKMKALRDDASVTPDQKKEKAKAIMDATNDQVKAILTADQLPKYEKFLQEMKDHRKHQDAPADKQ